MNLLKEKVDGFFGGLITREHLGNWASRAYHDLLTGGYVERKKIVLYPFLRTISKFHVEVDDVRDQYPCSVEELREIQDILCGLKQYDFQVKVAIPEQIYTIAKENPYLIEEKRNVFCNIKDALEEFMQTGCGDKIYEKIRAFRGMPASNDTLLDMLQNDIVRISSTIFDVEHEEIFSQMGLYIQKEEHDSRCEELMKYLEWYVGERSFGVLVSYQNGVPDMRVI